MSSGTDPESRQLYDATCQALRAPWRDETPSLAIGAVYAHLERERLIALGSGDPDRAGADLHGAWTITRVGPRLLRIR
jgi:hypothetical protein